MKLTVIINGAREGGDIWSQKCTRNSGNERFPIGQMVVSTCASSLPRRHVSLAPCEYLRIPDDQKPGIADIRPETRRTRLLE